MELAIAFQVILPVRFLPAHPAGVPVPATSGEWSCACAPPFEPRLGSARLDPVERIAGIGARPVLLQMGQHDFYVPLMAGLELRRAAGDGATVELKAYDSRADRGAFLAAGLGLARASF